MSLPRYPRYKESGVEWLGQVPEHWEVKRLKYLGEAIIGLTYSPADIVEEGGGTLVLRSSNVQGGEITFDDSVYVSTSIPNDLVTRVGDILICSRNGSRALIGKNATIDERAAGLTFGAFMTIFRSPYSDYVACVLNSPLFEFQSGAFMTSTINQLTVGVLKNFEVPLPPASERKEIAAFLKRETTKIDTLIAEQERLIKLLKEKQQAVISHAVTKGLDPNVPMKDSGIAWLGQVPAHWEIKRLHLVAGFKSGMAHEPYVEDSGEFICVNSRFVSTQGESRKFCTKNLSPARKNDVLIVMSDLPNGRALAKAYFVADDGPYAVNQRVGIVSPHAAHSRFLYHYLDRNPGFLLHDDGLNQTHLWNDLFKKFPILVPPHREQQAIAAFIDTELSRFDNLTSEAERAIDLLGERRSALIFAAVTGQIDVRSPD